MGWGIETDIRDLNGEVVLAHDMPHTGQTRFAEAIDQVSDLASGNGQVSLALNVKADGLATSCASLIAPLSDRCFFFDMSIPDMVTYLDAGLRVFTRHSDLEPEPALYSEAAGIWLDELRDDWLSANVIDHHVDRGKLVAVVSREIHRRDPLPLWKALIPFRDTSKLLLCTDLPHQAQEFFAL